MVLRNASRFKSLRLPPRRYEALDLWIRVISEQVWSVSATARSTSDLSSDVTDVEKGQDTAMAVGRAWLLSVIFHTFCSVARRIFYPPSLGITGRNRLSLPLSCRSNLTFKFYLFRRLGLSIMYVAFIYKNCAAVFSCEFDIRHVRRLSKRWSILK